MPSLLLLGESPPPGAPDYFRPFDCASGDRLAKHMLGLRSRAPLLEHVPRGNIFDTHGVGVPGKGPKWIPADARGHGETILRVNAGNVIVGLGDRPLAALGLAGLPSMTMTRVRSHGVVGLTVDVLALPHPSGRSTALNTEAKRTAVRAALLPEVVASVPGLRPWHFRLDEPAVLRDLAVAVSPLHPECAAATLVYIAEMVTSKYLPNTGADRPIIAWARGLSAPDLSIADAMAGISASIALPQVAEPSLRKALCSRARFAAKTIDFAAVDPAVIRATVARHQLHGIGGGA